MKALAKSKFSYIFKPLHWTHGWELSSLSHSFIPVLPQQERGGLVPLHSERGAGWFPSTAREGRGGPPLQIERGRVVPLYSKRGAGWSPSTAREGRGGPPLRQERGGVVPFYSKRGAGWSPSTAREGRVVPLSSKRGAWSSPSTAREGRGGPPLQQERGGWSPFTAKRGGVVPFYSKRGAGWFQLRANGRKMDILWQLHCYVETRAVQKHSEHYISCTII